MKWFSWLGGKSNRRIRSRQKRQPQRLSVFRPASYDRPSRKQKPLFARAWSGEQWGRSQRLYPKAPWFALSAAAHLLLLGAMATMILPSSTRRPTTLVPVQIFPSKTPLHAAMTPESVAAQPEPREPLPAKTVDIAALQKFRDNWTKRADRLEQRLLELAAAATNKERTIELQHQQLETVQQETEQLASQLKEKASQVETAQQEKERLASQLEEKATQERQLAAHLAEEQARLAEEQARRARLEAELAEQRERREAELRLAQEAYRKLIANLQTEITRKDIVINEFTDQLAITIVDRVLFPSGQATLTPEGKKILEKVGQALARGTDRQIQIEGHTDNQDIGPELKKRFASNWELSTARATEVVRYLLANTPLPAERLLAVGRAETMPVASNATEEGRQKNRRIEIILLPPDKLRRAGQDSQGQPG
ncbi:MAG: OmpA family protein [Candidatus Binatia bacterium]